MKRRSRKQNFLDSVCPFTVLEDRVTWGEWIALNIKGFFGAVVFYVFYILMVASAECIGVID